MSSARLDTPESAMICFLRWLRRSDGSSTTEAVIARCDRIGRMTTISPSSSPTASGTSTIGHCQTSSYKSCSTSASITN